MMIINHSISRRRGRTRGHILVAALVVGLVTGLALIAYLSWAGTQNRLIMRSQAWNGALALVEAGLEEALTQLKFSPKDRSLNGWPLIDGYYTKSRALGEGKFIVQIEPKAQPRIYSEGFLPAPLAGNTMISRKVMVTTTNYPTFHSAFVADRSIDLNGNRLRIDSFDSTDPTASTDGKYDVSKARDNGNVAINGGISDTLDVGNAEIYGKVNTGPNAAYEVGSNGSVGSMDWHNSGSSGIQPGWSASDFNQPLEPVNSPAGGIPALGGMVGSTAYQYILSSGSWTASQISGSVLVEGDAVLVVDGNVDFAGKNSIQIMDGASLTLYVNGTTVKMGGAGVNNMSHDPSKFAVYGGPKTTDIQLNGSVEFNGVIYAPSADIKMGGGGSAAVNFVGAAVGKSITLVGNLNVHYDESLQNLFSKGYVITSWSEI